ncbi:heme oxygenase-like, multi-helical [Metarhizium album ARSEF 1941]|uniref:Heme oxygenase-like, multi-helical n=1 Tax=Metarhizium album (strain ARSEF 1941) TaxID=1081103 RepID=A0A0B2WEU0_METAS|nr:heme oxygenase-like, multi-helical [Metarhizium album ARSEF 1941]KHN94386.1 heme oxygenase-like, multi-helical [Metarhizium album ARSEF 1941]
MNMNLPDAFVILHCHFVLPLAVLLPAAIYCLRRTRKRAILASAINTQPVRSEDAKRFGPGTRRGKPTQWYRDMFFRLQHLEDHPDILEAARDELLAMFSQGLSAALKTPHDGILGIDRYDAGRIWSFLEDVRIDILAQWAGYLERRRQGHGPELFGSVEAARAWLVQHAPVKFVDGAWLGHIHKITTPFALRGVTKDAWQVLSEELGDGDLSKHHVHLYRKLLEDVGRPLPEGHSADFINLAEWDGMENHGAWEAAVAQLLISLFPKEFLPEILGYNMHFEMVTVNTMQAAHELKGLGIDPYYFLIHIAIDNADSGHTAMATHAATRYVDMVLATEGQAAAEQAWRRVQIGYILSQTQGSHPCGGQQGRAASAKPSVPRVLPDAAALSTRVMEIFRAKALVSQQFHCQSKVRIGTRSLSEWLDPDEWKPASRHQHRQRELLDALGRARPWVVAGASSKSLLVRELSWGGRMFGAFTNNEVATLCSWIDALGPDEKASPSPSLYWSFSQRRPVASPDAVGELRDPACHHPVMLPSSTRGDAASTANAASRDPAALGAEPWKTQEPLKPPSKDRLPDTVALWFAHIGLLENTINVPSRTACPLHASILRLLRAQAGFERETDIVAGMDELKRHTRTSLVDVGLELISHMDRCAHAEPASLQDVLRLAASQGQGEASARLASDMLRCSVRPIENLGLLLGLALAFVKFKSAVGRTPGLLGPETRLALDAILAREKMSLEVCAEELRATDGAQYRNLERGFRLGMGAIQECVYLNEETTTSSSKGSVVTADGP